MVHPVTTSEARESLTKTVARFREQGPSAEPVVFGSHRKPEAVVLPYATYEALRELAEELRVTQMIKTRDQDDRGARYTLREVAERFGIDIDSL